MSVGGGGEAGGVTGFFLFTGAVGGGGSIHKFLQGQMNTFPRSGRLYGCDLLDLAHVRQASCQDEVFGSLLLEATFISKTKHYQPLVSLQPRWLKRLSWRPLIFPFVVAGAVRASQRFFVIRPDPVGHVSTVFELACMSNVPSARRRQFDVCSRLLCCFRHKVDVPNAEMSSEVVGNVRCAWKGQTFASCEFCPSAPKTSLAIVRSCRTCSTMNRCGSAAWFPQRRYRSASSRMGRELPESPGRPGRPRE